MRFSAMWRICGGEQSGTGCPAAMKQENKVVREKKDRKKKKGIQNILRTTALAAAVMLTLTSCAAPWADEPLPSPTPGRADTGFVVTGPDSYDSADTAILTGKDQKESTLTFLNLAVGKKYTLSMDGTTRLYDKYGESLSLEQIELGDVVDVKFLKSKKHLTTLQKSGRAWSYTNVERYEINTARGEISIGSGVYKLTSDTQYFSNGRNIGIMDISSTDVLSFQGIDSQILTVKVEKGHGYLSLANDADFVGGWIEVGQKQIVRITEDMLLVVPEGSYQVNVSHKGGGGTKDVVITRGEETVLDVGDFEIPDPQTGAVAFSLSPSATELYIDGAKTDVSSPVTLEYGLHQILARAEGYQSVTQYIRVDKEYMTYHVKLDEVQTGAAEPTGSTSESSSGDASETSPDSTASEDGYKVHIEAPEGAEVYLDGNYIGISPCSFKKVSGVHVIILRRSGYETRSYTVQVDNEDRDTPYSFADLVRSGDAEEEQGEEDEGNEEDEEGEQD